ncbi:MAG TPA: PepSY-like domain-containing protein [Balneolales bacterium]|nr:PepSY-like domain-containing protein [Balneolales bacterium]
MRKLIALFPLLFVLTFVGCNHKKSSDIPSAVTQAFSSKFANAQNVKWKKVNEFEYDVTFSNDNKKMKASFSEDGGLLSTTKQINESKLPKEVMSAVTKNYKKSDIAMAYEITNKKGTQYEVDVRQNGKVSDLTFDDTGDLIQQGS